MVSRRDLLRVLAAVPLLRLPAWRPGAPPAAPSAWPFPHGQVRLGAGEWADALDVNRRYLLSLDPDRLLYSFRTTAGLPTSAIPYGGWEAPDNELRGHFVGHYLSACALLASRTGEPDVAARGALMVSGLATCQQANGGGYLSAFPVAFFDRLRNSSRVWAPFYTWHKLMAGMLDSYTLMGDRTALGVVEGMAGWTSRWMATLDATAQQKMLNVEHGGMVATLYDLGDATGKTEYYALGDQFRHQRILAPMAAGRDELAGVHGNTTIPKVIGEGCRYDAINDAESRRICEYFWEDVTQHRSYATGGTTSGEGWVGKPDELAASLSQETAETCASYNMLKLTRQLFGWSPEARVRRFLRATAAQRHHGYPAPGGRPEALLHAPGLGLLEALRHAGPGLLVLPRHRRGELRQGGRQHLLPRRRGALGQSLHPLGAALARARIHADARRPASRRAMASR